MLKTLKLKIKNPPDILSKLANETNFVWNYINDLSFYMIKNKGKFLSAYDMHPYITGSTKTYLQLANRSVQGVTEIYCYQRNRLKKRKLKYRVSGGARRSLGWIPFKVDTIRFKNGCLYYRKYKFKVWDSYGLDNYKFKSGSFNEDAQGNWYLNVCVEVEPEQSNPKPAKEIGIDLGLKDFVSFSDGTKIEAPQFYRKLEPKLKTAQKANKKKQVSKIHAKIKNQRKDFLHKLSNTLTKENSLIVVGNVNSSKLAKTKMAKSIYDAGWYEFRTMLEYKAIRRQVEFKVVNEAWTSQTCSVCKSRTGPKGLEGVGIREWVCCECGSVHDRDTNAAKNILALGHQSLAVGVS